MRRWIALYFSLLVLAATSALASGPVKLNDPLPSGASGVQRAWISPDSQTVVYVGDLNTAGAYEIYSTDIGGGVDTRLNAAYSVGGSVAYSSENGVAFSQNSAMVLYLADVAGTGKWELYAAPRDGSQPAEKISLTITAPAGYVSSFIPGYDNISAIYLAATSENDKFELYRGYFAGGGIGLLYRVSPELPTGRKVVAYKLSPDQSRVVYLADQDTDDHYELYSAPAVGFLSSGSWAGTRISTPLTGSGQISSDFVITPDSNWVVYIADADGDGVNEAWKVSITGGASTQVGPPHISGAGPLESSLQVTPDGSRVLFRTQFNGSPYHLAAVSTSSWGYFLLTSTLPSTATVMDFRISPDSQWVAYIADADTDTVEELYSHRMDNVTGPFKLHQDLSGLQSVSSYRIGENNRVAFVADPGTVGDDRILATPNWGGPARILNPNAIASSWVSASIGLAHRGRLAVYRANQRILGARELWAVPTSGISPPVLLCDQLSTGKAVYNWWIAPDESRVVYIADRDIQGEYELFSTELPVAGFDSGPLLELLR